MSNNFKLFNTLQYNGSLSPSRKYSFDDLGDFIEEREKLKRKIETLSDTKLKVDYSDFSSHVAFDSALSKFQIAKDRILNHYPFDGNSEEVDSYFLTSSDYEKYVIEQWPRYVGYVFLDGATQYITASDNSNRLWLNSSSLEVSAWINPVITNENLILQRTEKKSNLILFSTDFDNLYWTYLGAFVSGTGGSGSWKDPNGTYNAFAVYDDTTSTSHQFSASFNSPINGGLEYTYSIFAKAEWSKLITFQILSGATQTGFYDFNMSSGTFGTVQAPSAMYSGAVEAFDDGWYRFSCRSTAYADRIRFRFFSGTNSFVWTGNNNLLAYIYGAQVSVQYSSNTYVSTSGTAYEGKDGYDFYLSGATDPHLKFTLYSGSSQTSVSSSYSPYTGSFANVAAIYDRPAGLLSLYVGRERVATSSISYGPVLFGPGVLNVGSGTLYITGSTSPRTYALYSGSINDVRVLHTASELYHQKNYSRYINAEDYVKAYYKFNEGVTGTSSVDINVVDYSKSALHGAILNYASGARVSGSVLANDPGDVILYSFHSGVVAFTSSIELTASVYDKDNKSNIFRLVSPTMVEADAESENLLSPFLLSMARYFDSIKLYIDQLPYVKTTNYEDFNETPDNLLPILKRYFGWRATDHFGDTQALEFLFGEGILKSTSGSLQVPLVEVRDQFWRRILNNLPYIYKTKGNRNSITSFLNTLGINKNLISLKEFGYVGNSVIENSRIHKEKITSMLGIGTGSLSSSFVKVPSLVTSSLGTFTVETMLQLPHASASFTASLLTGSVWQFIDPNSVTGSFALQWRVKALNSVSGNFVLTGSDGQQFSSSMLEVFTGDIIHVAAGIDKSSKPFIEVRLLDTDTLTSSSFIGSTSFAGIFTASNFDFIVGANSGSYYTNFAQGYFGQVRYWTKYLSASELDDHALNFESVGVTDPLTSSRTLAGHWSLSENVYADSAGQIARITDLSRNGKFATGSGFAASSNPYKKFLADYNMLSPSLDLKWTENKVRVRNQTEIDFDDAGYDTNEVALEFNLVDHLNEDISRIFSTMDMMSEVIGKPINKYRDEYADLESYRRIYFDRLSTSVNFNKFFNLFKWFDRKISESIKQLLPARTVFIGGEQVVESHFLERNKYSYKYPVFRTPKDINVGEVSASADIKGQYQTFLNSQGAAKGTHVSTLLERDTKGRIVRNPRETSVVPEASLFIDSSLVSYYADGDEKVDRNSHSNPKFFRIKYSGDQLNEINSPQVGINHRNEIARRRDLENQVKNYDGYRSGSLVHPKIGNAFINKALDSSKDAEAYAGYRKFIKLAILGISGTSDDNRWFYLRSPGTSQYLTLTQSFRVYDANNVKLTKSFQDSGFLANVIGSSAISAQNRLNARLSFEMSATEGAITYGSNVNVAYRDSNSTYWTSAAVLQSPKHGNFLSQSDGWMKFQCDFILSGANVPTSFALNSDNVYWYITSSITTASFRNFRVEWDQQLTQEGLEKYRTIDNQNNSDIFTFLNVDVLKGVE